MLDEYVVSLVVLQKNMCGIEWLDILVIICNGVIYQFYGQVFSVELNPSSLSEADASKAGLRPVKDWRAFGLKGYSGIVLN